LPAPRPALAAAAARKIDLTADGVPLFFSPVLAFAPLKFFPGVSPAQDLAVNEIQDGTPRSPLPA